MSRQSAAGDERRTAVRDVPDAPLWVQAGGTRLRQILGNLLTNALDALAEKAPPRRLWVITSQDQHGVILTLRDNGPGFRGRPWPTPTRPFFTTKTTAKGSASAWPSAIAHCAPSAAAREMGNHPEGGAVVRLHLLPGVPRRRRHAPGGNPRMSPSRHSMPRPRSC